MALDHSIDSTLTLGVESRDVCSCCINFSGEGIGFSLAFGILRRGAFALARQTFCLHTETLERAFELSCNFTESLSHCGVFEQLRARILNLGFCL